MLHIWVSQSAGVDVLVEVEGEGSGDASHHDGDWDEVPVPELELLVAARDEVHTSEVHDYEEFYEFAS